MRERHNNERSIDKKAESSVEPFLPTQTPLRAFGAHVKQVQELGDSLDALWLKNRLFKPVRIGIAAGLVAAPGLAVVPPSIIGYGLITSVAGISSYIRTRKGRSMGHEHANERTQEQLGQTYELYKLKNHDDQPRTALRWYGPRKENPTIEEITYGLKTMASFAVEHRIDEMAVGTDVLRALDIKIKPNTTMADWSEHLKKIKAGGSAKRDMLLVESPQKILQLVAGDAYEMDDLVRILSLVKPDHPIAKTAKSKLYGKDPSKDFYKKLLKAAVTELERSSNEVEPENMLHDPKKIPTRIRLTENNINGETVEKSGSFVAAKTKGYMRILIQDGKVHVLKDGKLEEANKSLANAFPHLSRDPNYIRNRLMEPHANPDATIEAVAYELVRLLTRPTEKPLSDNNTKTDGTPRKIESSIENIVKFKKRPPHQGAYLKSDEWSLMDRSRLRFPERKKRMTRFALAGTIAGVATFTVSSFIDQAEKANEVSAAKQLSHELKVDQTIIPSGTVRAKAAKNSDWVGAWEDLQDTKRWLNDTIKLPFGNTKSKETKQLIPNNNQQSVGNDNATNANKTDWYLQAKGMETVGYWTTAISHRLHFDPAVIPDNGLKRKESGKPASIWWDTTPKTVHSVKLPVQPLNNAARWIKVSRMIGDGDGIDNPIKIPVLGGTQPMAASIDDKTPLQLMITEDGTFSLKRIPGKTPQGGILSFWITPETSSHSALDTPTNIDTPSYNKRAINAALARIGNLPTEPRARAQAIARYIEYTWEYKRDPVPLDGMRNLVNLQQYIDMTIKEKKADCNAESTLIVLGDPYELHARFGYFNGQGIHQNALELSSHEAHQWTQPNREPKVILDNTPRRISDKEASFFMETSNPVPPAPKNPSKLPLYLIASGLVAAGGIRYRRQLAESLQSTTKGVDVARQGVIALIEMPLRGQKGQQSLHVVEEALYAEKPDLQRALRRADVKKDKRMWNQKSRPDLYGPAAMEALAALKKSHEDKDASTINIAKRSALTARAAAILRGKSEETTTKINQRKSVSYSGSEILG